MITKNRKGIKKLLYLGLTLFSTVLSLATQAADTPEEDKKYNLVGVALFSGRDPVSRMIKTSTKSKISHVGVILADSKDEGQWYCFESTGSVQEAMKGVYPYVHTPAPWNTVVNDYDGKIDYRLFVFQDMNRTDGNEVTDFVKKYEGKSYTRNPLRLIRALLGINRPSRSKVLKTAFCSELTAKMFMDLGILQEGTAGNYLPKHFSSKKRIKLAPGIYLTPGFKEK